MPLQKDAWLTKKSQPFLTNDLRDKLKNIDRLLTIAIKSNIKDDWTTFREAEKLVSKEVNAAKETYISESLSCGSRGWKNIQKFNGLEKSQLPSKIINIGKVLRSPCDIANVANELYINKI